MSEVVKSRISEVNLDKVVQNYFRQCHEKLKPSDIEGLIKQFDFPEERIQVAVARQG